VSHSARAGQSTIVETVAASDWGPVGVGVAVLVAVVDRQD